MNIPLVTIGIPTYNRASSYLRESLASALAQTYPKVEIIVSDNCSTDGTEDFLLSQKDERVRYFRHDPAVGPHENADYCLQKARGEYFLLLHDDDLIDKDFVQVCVDAIAGREIGFVRTGARKIDERGRVKAERTNPHRNSTLFQFLDAVLCGNAVTYFCNTLYNTELLRAIGGFHSRAFVYQDVIATIKLACSHERVDLEAPKASYRIHGSKLGAASDIARWCDDSLEILDLMCEKMPEKAAYFRAEGRRMLCRRNYNRARRVRTVCKRVYAYFLVYRKFGQLPVWLLGDRIKRKIAKIMGSNGAKIRQESIEASRLPP